MADIGKNISRIRLFKKIGQKDMADYLKISQQEYSRIEQKKGLTRHY
ncbi:MAG: helix-turn-helix transcriptional regulator [Phycisphaerales bacterium]|nr:helix-turn-helix transcriptional regulator [Phycisphaerales bacterium]